MSGEPDDNKWIYLIGGAQIESLIDKTTRGHDLERCCIGYPTIRLKSVVKSINTNKSN
jgi:hypothetical protein